MENKIGLVIPLAKPLVTRKEVILYLELLNTSNDQIIQVLKKTPSLPEYERLPWVMESKLDKKITKKLKEKTSLDSVEKLRLRQLLTSALILLKKWHRESGLKQYLEKL